MTLKHLPAEIMSPGVVYSLCACMAMPMQDGHLCLTGVLHHTYKSRGYWHTSAADCILHIRLCILHTLSKRLAARYANNVTHDMVAVSVCTSEHMQSLHRHANPVFMHSMCDCMCGCTYPAGCGWRVGWDNDLQMVQTAIASATIIVLSILARAAGVSHAVIGPFQLSLNVFGTNCLLLAGLIMCNRYYSRVSDLLCTSAKYMTTSLHRPSTCTLACMRP